MANNNNNISADLFDQVNGKPIAKIILNGYNIEAGGPLGHSGAMRSFKMVDGDLWDHWNEQVAVNAVAANGEESVLKISAIPTEGGKIGFVEFL